MFPDCSVVYPNKGEAVACYTDLVVEFNGWFRSFRFGNHMNIGLALHVFYKSLFSNVTAESVTVTMDRYDCNNEMRKKHYGEKMETKRRLYTGKKGYVELGGNVYSEKEVPLSDAEVESMSVSSPMEWDRMWNTPKGKIKALQCMADLLRSKFSREDGSTEYVVDDVVGKITSTHDMPENVSLNYGEGDIKAIRWALYRARTRLTKDGRPRRVLVVTIDWDLVISLIPYGDCNVDVLISRPHIDKMNATSDPFAYDSTLVYSDSSIAKKAVGSRHVSAYEIITVSNLMFLDGMENIDRRLCYMMCLLCVNGGDFNKGLNRFGFSEATTREMMKHLNSVDPFLESIFSRAEPRVRALRFHPSRFMEFLRHASPKKKKKTIPDLSEFVKEILNTIWVIMYWTGFDSTRHVGGPPPPDTTIEMFPEARDVKEAIQDSTLVFPCIDFVESHYSEKVYHPFGYAPAHFSALCEAGFFLREEEEE